jgi:hypothetical protein
MNTREQMLHYIQHLKNEQLTSLNNCSSIDVEPIKRINERLNVIEKIILALSTNDTYVLSCYTGDVKGLRNYIEDFYSDSDIFLKAITYVIDIFKVEKDIAKDFEDLRISMPNLNSRESIRYTYEKVSRELSFACMKINYKEDLVKMQKLQKVQRYLFAKLYVEGD